MRYDSEKAWDIVVVGGIGTEIIAGSRSLPHAGETVEGELFSQGPGGRGANQAIAAARLGARVAIIGCVGRDSEGDSVIANLKREGVWIQHVMRDAQMPTGRVVVMADEAGHRQTLYVPGANHGLTAAYVHRAADVIAHGHVLLTEFGVPLECSAAAIHLAQTHGASVLLDPTPAVSLPPELLQKIDVITLGTDTARTLTQLRVENRPTARVAASRLLEAGVGAAAIAIGGEGYLLTWKGGECWVPKLPVKSVDACGASDAFAAALAMGIVEGRSWPETAGFAAAAAALSTMAVGSQSALPRRDEVDALIDAGLVVEEQELVPA